MKEVFVDAAHLIAVLDAHDELHELAINAVRSLGRVQLVTSELVLIEVLNFMGRSSKVLREAAPKLALNALSSLDIYCVRHNDFLMDEWLALYRSRHDKNWSLTDCISMIIMQRYEIREVLTSTDTLSKPASLSCSSDERQRSARSGRFVCAGRI